MIRPKELIEKIDLDGDSYPVELEATLGKELASKFDISYNLAEETVNTGQPEVDRNFHELTQHLFDLGYLSEEYFNEPEPDFTSLFGTHDFQSAIYSYLKEDHVLLSTIQEALVEKDIIRLLNDFETFENVLPLFIQRLNLLTSLDGAFKIKKSLKIGDRDLYTRILHYRLKSLGQFGMHVAEPVNKATIAGLYKILHITGKISLDRFLHDRPAQLTVREIEYSGDFNILIQLYVQNHRYHMLFYQLYEIGKEHPEGHLEYLYIQPETGQWVFATDQKSFRQKRRENNVGPIQAKRQIRERGNIVQRAYDDQNRFGLELLQAVLWMRGYYHGRIDGIWGPLSHGSLIELLNFEGINRTDMLIALEDASWAINLPALYNLLSLYEATVDTALQEQYIENNVAPQGAVAENAAIEDHKIESYNEKKGFFIRFWEKIKKFGRRVYYGIKSVVASAVRAVRKAWNLFKKNIVGPVVSFFKHIGKKIREGLQWFLKGLQRFMHFVLKKPIMTPNPGMVQQNEPYVITRFEFGSDATIFTHTNSSSALLLKHNSLINKLQKSLSILLRVAGEVISLLIDIWQPVGWFKIALRIARLVKELIVALIRQQQEKQEAVVI